MRFVETTLPANADIGRAAWFEEGFRHGETDAGGVARDEGVFLGLFVESRGTRSCGLTAGQRRHEAEGEEALDTVVGADRIGHHEAELA